MSLKLDILVFAAHPDDAELSVSGTIVKHIAAGKKVGIVDLTRGELGSRGSASLRDEEAAKASEILGLTVRENLALKDGFFEIDEDSLKALIKQIRKYQPDVVLCNAVSDRHPDHGRGGELAARACFLSGLVKIESFDNGIAQAPWRPGSVFHYIQDHWIDPDFVVDISEHFDTKIKAVKAFSSQFFNEESTEPETPISSPEFMEMITGRAVAMGRLINTKYGEGFTVTRPLGVDDITSLG